MLDETTFKQDLKALMAQCKNDEASSDAFADGLVELIGAFIRSATVTVAAEIPVTTPSGPGSTSAEGTGTIS